jgi:DNA-binding CsgD family transcriptional regulator
MARVTKKEKLQELQDQNQPALLDDSQLPVCLPVLEAVRQRRYEHTADRLTDDDQKCLRLVELLLARWGVKKIAREMNISPHTVRAARRALTQQGKLAPYIQRVVETMEDAIEAGVANYRDALEGGLIPATQIPVGLGIIFDKRQLATGAATSIQQRLGDEDVPSVDKLNAFLDGLKPAQVSVSGGSIDSESTGNGQKPQQIPAGAAQDAGLDANGGRPGPDATTPAALPDLGMPALPAVEAEARPDPAGPGGEGVPTGTTGSKLNALGSENQLTKGKDQHA